MNDLISREKAIETLKEYEAVEFDNFTKTGPVSMMTVSTITNCIEAIAKLPSTEPERKTGKWIDERPNCYTRKVYCSECGQVALNEVKSEGNVYYPRNTFDFALSNFCPNCGADMRGE